MEFQPVLLNFLWVFFEQYGCYNIAIMFPLQIPVIYYITAFILSCVSHSTLGLHVDSSAVKL